MAQIFCYERCFAQAGLVSRLADTNLNLRCFTVHHVSGDVTLEQSQVGSSALRRRRVAAL